MAEPEGGRLNPYIGPRSFKMGERLYGRDQEVTELLQLLIAERIVLFYSPSGAGKSSLIGAALAPALREAGFRVLPVMRLNAQPPADQELPPGFNRYAYSAMLTLEEGLVAEGLPEAQRTPFSGMASLPLKDYLERRPTVGAESAHEVLIFDQFEELLTLDPVDQDAKAAFMAQLGAALRDRSRWALISMREDYRSGLDPYLRLLPTQLRTSFRLDLLGADAAREAIRKPARDAGAEFSPAAVDRLVDSLRRVQVQSVQPGGGMVTETKLGPYVEPVQLQVVCYRIWEGLSPDEQEILESHLEAGGDIDQALAGYYADRVAAVARDTGVRERRLREWIDRNLITEQGIRGQALQGDEARFGLTPAAVRALVDAHVVRAEERRGAVWYELAHDRLVQPVRADNAAWFQKHLSVLETQATLWEARGRPENLLLNGEELAAAERWAAENQPSPTEQQFLEACRQARSRAEQGRELERLQQESATRLQELRHRRRVAGATSVVAVLTASLAFWALRERREAIAQTRLARRSETLARQAEGRAKEAAEQARKAEAKAKEALNDANIEKKIKEDAIRQISADVRKGRPTGIPLRGYLTPSIRATFSERLGMEALVAGKLGEAREHLEDAEEAYPTLHSVKEILQFVLTDAVIKQYQAASPAQRGAILKSIFTAIEKSYAWGIPNDIRAKFQAGIRGEGTR